MATKYVSLKGTTKYVNGQYGGLFEADQKYGNFQIRLYPDTESWEKYKKSGLRLEPKNDEDGDYLTFRRPEQKLLNKELVNFGRPKVFFKEGIEPTKNIGHGSTIEVNVAVYDTREGKGHRLEAVRVLELVEYNRDGPVGNFIELKDDVGDAESVEVDAGPVDTKSGTPVRNTKEPTEVAPWDESPDPIPFGEEKAEEVKSEPKEPKATGSVATVKSGASPFKRMSR